MPKPREPYIAGSRQVSLLTDRQLPVVISQAGENASRRFVEFFTATIRNRNTREAYARAVWRFFSWCEVRGIPLSKIEPILVALYIEELQAEVSAPTVKQHLAAIRMLFDWLTTGNIIPDNPAAAVKGPKHVVKKGKTPVLLPEETAHLLDTIPTNTIGGLRDRALIGLMVFSFARIGAALAMNVDDYFLKSGKRWWFRIREKGGKHHELPAHHKAEEFMDSYLNAAGMRGNSGTPLFRTLDRHRQLTDRRLHRTEALMMIRRRSRQANLPYAVCNHTFRATGITAYLSNGGTLENAQRIAAHESPRTTSLYDRTSDEVSLDEIERILI